MFLNQQMKRRIGNVMDRMTGRALLLDADGRVILPEDSDLPPLGLPYELRMDPEQPRFHQGYTIIGTGREQPMYLCLPGETNANKDAALLCAGMICELTNMEMQGMDRDGACAYIMSNDVGYEEAEGMARQYGIKVEHGRCVLLVSLHNLDSDSAMAILSDVISEENGMVMAMSRSAVALVLPTEGQEDDEIFQLAQAIENTFATEANASVYIGIGSEKHHVSGLRQSYLEARRAIDVGKRFNRNSRVFRYSSLLAERFCSDVPAEVARAYARVLFNEDTAKLLNDTMMQTIEAFFDTSLNLSETARKLYIHRNTLVYRLDKIQKTIGLDLRSFDDAATFRLMTLLSQAEDEKTYRR